MEAKELRLGNYVDYEKTTHIIHQIINSVCASYWYKSDACDSYSHTYNDINPIPLTEEWLLKFGFEYEPKHLVFSINNEFIIDRDFSSPESFDFYVERINKDVELKHVHQLQNLYFALTGDELTIK